MHIHLIFKLSITIPLMIIIALLKISPYYVLQETQGLDLVYSWGHYVTI